MFDIFIRFKPLMFISLFFISAPALMVFPVSAVAQTDAKLIKFWDDREPQSIMTVAHGPWQEILEAYVDDLHPSGINRFDYRAVGGSDAAKLKKYISYLQLLEPRQLNGSEAKAYWINLYNALMVDLIIEAVQEDNIKSVRRLGRRSSPKDIATVVMQDISLEDIEHGILRPIWKDARVHYALTTGALSGGNLQKVAYTGENVEELLIKAEKEYLNHDRGIRFENGRAIASSVFDWYRRDFVASKSKSELIGYIAQRVDETKRAQLIGISRIRFDYDWTLNSPDSE